MARRSGTPTAAVTQNTTDGATFTLVGGATIKECLQTKGDGKYVELRTSNNALNASNNPKVRLDLFDIPGFDPTKIQGPMGIIKFRILAWNKVSGTDFGLNGLIARNVTNPVAAAAFQTIDQNTGFVIGMPATEFYLWTPITFDYLGGSPSHQCLQIELGVTTSGGVGPIYRVQLDYAAFEYGEAGASIDVIPTAQGTVAVGVNNWTTPDKSLVLDGVYASLPPGTSYLLRRSFAPFALPVGAVFQGIDILEVLVPGQPTDVYAMSLMNFPLSSPVGNTPQAKMILNGATQFLQPSGSTATVWGFGPGFDWSYPLLALNGWPGITLATLLAGGYALGSLATVRAGQVLSTDAAILRVYYDGGGGDISMQLCEA